MRLKTILIAAAGVLLGIIVAAVVALRSIDLNQYKGLIAEQAKAATGRELRIGGNLDLHFGLSPAVVIEDVSFANAPWGSRPEMVRAHRFEVEVALIPLLFRDVRIKHLVLVQPDILLETDAKGNGNWSLGDAAAPPAPPASKPSETRAGLVAIAVEKVRIEKGTLTYRDGRTKRATRLALDRLDLRAKDVTSPLTIDFAGAYAGKPFTLAGTVGPLSELQAPSPPYPVRLALKAGGTAIEAEGTIAKPMEAAGLDLKVSAKGEDVAEVAKLAGKAIPAVGPFAMTARVTGTAQALSLAGIDASVGKAERVLVRATGAVKDALNARGFNVAVTVESKDPKAAAKAFGAELPLLPPLSATARLRDAQGAYAFEDLKASLGKSHLAGSVTIWIAGPRPRVKAQLASTLVDLSELLPREGARRTGAAASQKTPTPSEGKRVFPADPLPLSVLRTADADLDLKVDRLVLPNTSSVEGLVARVALSGGRLEVRPFGTRIGGGAVTGQIALDASSQKTATLAAKVDAKAIDLNQVLRQMGNPDLVTGVKTDFALNLRGSGGSVRDLMAGLNGDLVLVLGEGKIHSSFIDWLGADLLTQIAEKLNPFGTKDPYTDLKCGVIGFAAKDGVATSDRTIAFETSKMTLVSSGTANLKTEAIDFSLRPEARQVTGIGAGELVKLLRVRGTLAEPMIGVDELGVGRTALSIGAAVATGGLSFLAETLLKKATADPRPCETAKGKMPAPARPGSVPSSAAPSGQEPPKQGSGIEQFFRGLFGK
ncbi:MAG: AsmA family protein [candidate division NC10 bacterium]|nr:AsmA family protein [candidate division NC10 bacterium]